MTGRRPISSAPREASNGDTRGAEPLVAKEISVAWQAARLLPGSR